MSRDLSSLASRQRAVPEQSVFVVFWNETSIAFHTERPTSLLYGDCRACNLASSLDETLNVGADGRRRHPSGQARSDG
eukprot:6186414-Pleurochrysis_carterae.AAC.1